MTDTSSNVHNFGVPGPVAQSSGGGGGNDVGERIARLEARMEYLATKEDIQSIRTEIETASNKQLKWGIGILVTVVIAIIGLSLKS
jgi:hypothetical protein